MPGRQPAAEDFPSYIQVDVVPPPTSHAPVNILLLLHGLGDNKVSFSNLGRQLQLPETTCISIQAPTPMPFDLGGFHWGDDIIFDQITGHMDFDTGFRKSTKLLAQEIIGEILVKKCGYQHREIIAFGFGQGAMAALDAVVSSSEELGGAVSIGGPMPTSTLEKTSAMVAKNRTPILILGGSADSLVTRKTVTNLRRIFEFVEYTMWKKAGDGLPQNREEMFPIMEFLSRRLRSRRGVPEGSVEIG